MVVGGCSLAVVVDCAICGVFLVVVCIILLEWVYYFIVVDILFYYDVYIILLCQKLK